MRTSVAIALSALAVLAGCGSTDESTPIACLEGASSYLRALEDATGTVRLTDDTPISSCLTQNQAGGALASVGTAMVTAATELQKVLTKLMADWNQFKTKDVAAINDQLRAANKPVLNP